MISENFFLDVCLPNNIIVGAHIRLKRGERYAWHRVIALPVNEYGLTIHTTELMEGFLDGKSYVWKEDQLLKEIETRKDIFWEQDVLAEVLELAYIHIN